MRIHEKIKAVRESKKLSQNYLAYELNLSQSQYSRREKGEIHFVPEEIVKVSKLLGITISELFGEEIAGLKFAEDIENGSASLKLMEQYELRIKEKDEMISLLKNLIKNGGLNPIRHNKPACPGILEIESTGYGINIHYFSCKIKVFV